MSIRVVALVRDCGDGSCGLHWFTNIEKAQAILDDDDQCEQYGVNEGSFAVDLKLPDSTDLAAAGIHVDDEDRGSEDDVIYWKGIKIKSIPASSVCSGCLGEPASWHDDELCRTLPGCVGIIWVKDE